MQITIVILFVILIILLGIIPLLTKPFQYRYSPKKYLLTRAELNFYKYLVRSLPPQYTVMCKVRLADILFTNNYGRARMYAFNKIKSKHVDFVIVDFETSEIKTVIELNDNSHFLPKRVKRDKFLADTFKQAGVSFKTVTTKHTYAAEELYTLVS